MWDSDLNGFLIHLLINHIPEDAPDIQYDKYSRLQEQELKNRSGRKGQDALGTMYRTERTFVRTYDAHCDESLRG